MKQWIWMLAIWWFGAAVTNAAPETNNLFIIDSIQLHPKTFEVTLVINVGPLPPIVSFSYGVEAHVGPPTTNAVAWTLIGTQTATTSKLTFVDHLSGPLLHSGKTYRGVVEHNLWTVNEAFVGYPRLKDPNVRVCSLRQGNEFVVEYGEGIYSNTASIRVPDGVTAAFFRMWSPDDDPTNAVIQACTNSLGTNWAICVME